MANVLATLLFSINSASAFDVFCQGMLLPLGKQSLPHRKVCADSHQLDLKEHNWFRPHVQVSMQSSQTSRRRELGLRELEMEGIQNFRQVSSSLPGIYRSGALEQATAADAANILDGARIRTVIDLRSSAEIEKAQSSSTYFGQALLRAFDKGSKVGPGRVASEGSGSLRRVHIPLVRDTESFFEEVASRISPLSKAKAASLRMFNGKAAADEVVYTDVSSGRQDILNTAILRKGADLGPILRVIADARFKGAVLFHGSQGKDRTGVVAALLQYAARDSEDRIIDRYAASERLLQYDDAQDGETGSTGIDWSAWRGSPPEAMAKTLRWIKSKYMITDRFLREIGCYVGWEDELLRHVKLPA